MVVCTVKNAADTTPGLHQGAVAPVQDIIRHREDRTEQRHRQGRGGAHVERR